MADALLAVLHLADINRLVARQRVGRHASRRLTSREFLSRYDKILKEDGTIEFKTDNRGLFDFSLEEVPEAGWKLEAHTFDLHHNEEMMVGNVMTEYEEKFSSIGNPICKMIIRR